MQTRKKSVTVKSGYRLKVKERLRESEINFVFCEWELFCPLATKQYTVLFLPNSRVNLEPRVSCALHNSLPLAKNEKHQKWQGLNVLAIFPIPPSATSCTHRLPCRVGRCFCTKVQRSPPETRTLYKGGKEVYLFYLVRFSRFVKVLFILILSIFDTLADSADICKCLIKRIIN